MHGSGVAHAGVGMQDACQRAKQRCRIARSCLLAGRNGSLAPASSPCAYACCCSARLPRPIGCHQPSRSSLQVVKAASGKFHPLHQWFYFDSIESLPDEPLSAEEVAPQVGGVSGIIVLRWPPCCASNV